MWMWRGVLCVSLVYGLALDSNTIRSKETELQARSHGDQVERPVRRRTETASNSNREQTPPGGGCSNRAQRRQTDRPEDRQVDRQVDRQEDRQVDRQEDRQVDTETDRQINRTKALEMASCVRSGDCAPGLCCVRYLTGKRCARIPGEGEACLLRGSTKLRRKLGRCDCEAGLACRAAPGKAKGQGVCQPRQRHAPRKTRHSGKKRRTAERSC